jgi:DNA-binding MarR family transcriptional regulator
MMITPEPPLRIHEGRFKHGSILDDIIPRSRVSSQRKSIAGLQLERALFPLLVIIERLGPIGVVDLAGRVGRDYTTVSRQVARLEALGLCGRRNSDKDRRMREAEITTQGKLATGRRRQRPRANGRRPVLGSGTR